MTSLLRCLCAPSPTLRFLAAWWGLQPPSLSLPNSCCWSHRRTHAQLWFCSCIPSRGRRRTQGRWSKEAAQRARRESALAWPTLCVSTPEVFLRCLSRGFPETLEDLRLPFWCHPGDPCFWTAPYWSLWNCTRVVWLVSSLSDQPFSLLLWFLFPNVNIWHALTLLVLTSYSLSSMSRASSATPRI